MAQADDNLFGTTEGNAEREAGLDDLGTLTDAEKIASASRPNTQPDTGQDEQPVAEPASNPSTQDQSEQQGQGKFPVDPTPQTGAQGEQALAELERDKHSALEAAGAAVDDWLTTDIIRAFNKPEFVPGENFNLEERIKNVPIPLDDTSRKYLGGSVSDEDFDFRVDKLKDQAENAEKMGDHPWVSFAASMGDPVWFGVDLASMGVGAAAQAGRAGVGAQRAARAAAGGTSIAGLEEASSDVRPMSNKDMMMDSAFGALGGLMAGYGQKRMNRPRGERVSQDTADMEREAGEAVSNMGRGPTEGESYRYRDKTDTAGNPQKDDYGNPMYEQTQNNDRWMGDTPQEAREISGIQQENKDIAGRHRTGTEDSVARPSSTPEGNASEASTAPHRSSVDALERSKIFGDRASGNNKAFQRAIKDGRRQGHGHGSAREMIARKLRDMPENTGNVQTQSTKLLAKHLLDTAGPALDNIPVQNVTKTSLGRVFKGAKDRTGALQPQGLYESKSGIVLAQHDGSLSTLLHETAHGLTLDKLDFGRKNPDTVHGRLYKELSDLQKHVEDYNSKYATTGAGRQEKYFESSPEEMVAGLFSDNPFYLKRLEEAPSMRPGEKKGALHDVFDNVKKLLGITPKEQSALGDLVGITDELIKHSPNETVEFLGEEMPRQAATKINAEIGKMVDKDPFLKRFLKGATDSKNVGEKAELSLHKYFAKNNKYVADTLVADPTDPKAAANSIAGRTRANRRDLTEYQVEVERLIKKERARRAQGTGDRIKNATISDSQQNQLNEEMVKELFRREQEHVMGSTSIRPASSAVSDTADAVDRTMDAALEMMQKNGIPGADDIVSFAGWFSRRWEPAQIEEFVKKDSNRSSTVMGIAGKDREAALEKMRTFAGEAVANANPDWSSKVSKNVGAALIDRAVRRANGTDSGFRMNVGGEAISEIEDVLRDRGLSQADQQEVLDVVGGVVDEAGKPTYLKNRINLDLEHSRVLDDGTEITIMDLIDSDLMTNMDRYLDSVASQAAFSRAGIHGERELTQLKQMLMEEIPDPATKRQKGEMFDNTVDYLKGLPAGDVLPSFIRIGSASAQMVSLAGSGLWDIIDLANSVGRWGMRRSFKGLIDSVGKHKEFYQSLSDPENARDLQQVLYTQNYNDIRIKPFIKRLEDNFMVGADQNALNAINNTKQYIPYLNGMKFTHSLHSRMTAAMLTREFEKAAKGNAKARQMWERYGIPPEAFDWHAEELSQKGSRVSDWSDELWNDFQSPFATAMDESVLYERTGEIPGWAVFSSLGKFIFSFRNYVLMAHNKLMANTLKNDGFQGLSLMLMSEMPLAMLATQANSVLNDGEFIDDPSDLASQSIDMLSGIGLFSEATGVLLNGDREFGAPGLSGVDKLYSGAGKMTDYLSGGTSTSSLGSQAVSSVPMLAVIPGIGAVASMMDDDE